jgi:hypothetical protein
MEQTIPSAHASRGAAKPRRAQATRVLKTGVLGALSCAVATAGLMIPAAADVADPHTVFVLKNDSIVEVEGLVDGEPLTVRVLRDGVEVGSVAGNASNPGGTFIINHDLCWDNFTPEILPGDVVTVTTNAGVDRVPVRNISVVEGPSAVVGDSFTIRGTITPRVPVGQLQVEARGDLANGNPFRPLAPNPAPDPDEVRGVITYDNATGGAFTARFSGLTAAEAAAVPDLGEFNVAHVAATSAGGDLKEVTMATEGSPVPGPGCSLSAPVVRHAVTDLSRAVINKNNQDRELRVSGMTLDATGVSVRLRDRDGTVRTRAARVNGASGPQTWSTTFPARAFKGLSGRIVASASYTSGGQALNGATMSLLKDVVAPRRPQASPDGGTYNRRQAVSLSAAAGTQIRYTLGRRQPAPRLRTGNVYRGRQLRITSSQTLKAIAVDKAGNVSRLRKERYVIR